MAWWKKKSSEEQVNLDVEGAKDRLDLRELVSEEGTWSGLLFDNPSLGIAPQLTWTFAFAYRDVEREGEPIPVDVTVDWVPLPGHDWAAMAGARAAGGVFAEPIEASIYFGEHHRYDEVTVEVAEQQALRLLAKASLRGDVDGLGIPALAAEAWLTFTGIEVQLTDCDTPSASLSALANFTNVDGLEPHPSPTGGTRFVPNSLAA